MLCEHRHWHGWLLKWLLQFFAKSWVSYGFVQHSNPVLWNNSTSSGDLREDGWEGGSGGWWVGQENSWVGIWSMEPQKSKRPAHQLSHQTRAGEAGLMSINVCRVIGGSQKWTRLPKIPWLLLSPVWTVCFLRKPLLSSAYYVAVAFTHLIYLF